MQNCLINKTVYTDNFTSYWYDTPRVTTYVWMHWCRSH